MQTINQLTQQVKHFHNVRDWNKYRNPANDSTALFVSATELWSLTSKRRTVKNKNLMTDELADIFHWLLLLADELGYDLTTIFQKRMAKNGKEHPVKNKTINKLSLKDKGNSEISRLTGQILAFIKSRDWKLHPEADSVAYYLFENINKLYYLLTNQLSGNHNRKLRSEIKNNKEFVQDQLSDILYWLLFTAYRLDIDISKALKSKLQKDELKYPVAKVKGRHNFKFERNLA